MRRRIHALTPAEVRRELVASCRRRGLPPPPPREAPAPTPPPPPVGWTLSELAKHALLPATTLKMYADSHRIPGAVRVETPGGAHEWRIPEADARAWIHTHREEGVVSAGAVARAAGCGHEAVTLAIRQGRLRGELQTLPTGRRGYGIAVADAEAWIAGVRERERQRDERRR